MARRTEILNYLVDRLSTINTTNGNLTNVSQVSRGYKYLDDINDFPTITLGGTPREDLVEIGDGQHLRSLRQSIRAYVMSDEDSIYDSENLAHDIETVVTDYAANAANLSVHRSQVIAISTDEGLFSPYGIVDVEVEMVYEED
jgi:hypothetical protein